MKKLLLIVSSVITSCQNNAADTIIINVNHSQQIVKVTGLPEVALNGIKRDSISLQAWQNLFPVMAMQADTDMRDFQRPIMGKYQAGGTAITFTPDTLFKKGETYFARYYRYDKEISVLDMVLHKRTPGKASYTELIFKY